MGIAMIVAKKERFIDILTVLSCVAVVFLHCNGVFWSRPTGSKWITSNLIETLFYFAVPVFFMISGYTLMEYRKRYDDATFIRKRFDKTVIPFLAWSFIAYVFVGYWDGNLFVDFSLSKFILDTINCSYFQVYWFFIPLFACYLSIPVLSGFCDKGKDGVLLLITYSFISYSVIPFVSRFCNIGINSNLLSPVGGGYVLYLLLGYVFGKYDISRIKRLCIYVLGVIGFFCHFFGTLLLSPVDHVNDLFKGYLNFPCVLYSVAIFVFFKHNEFSKLFENDIFYRFFCLIKSCSLPIYLIHGFFVYYIIPSLGFIRTDSTLYRLIGPFAIIFMCIFVTVCIRKIPYANKIVP